MTLKMKKHQNTKQATDRSNIFPIRTDPFSEAFFPQGKQTKNHEFCLLFHKWQKNAAVYQINTPKLLRVKSLSSSKRFSQQTLAMIKRYHQSNAR